MFLNVALAAGGPISETIGTGEKNALVAKDAANAS